MNELFLENYHSKIDLSDEEFVIIKSKLERKIIKKKEFLIKTGKICNYNFFVNEELLYSHYDDENGNKNVVNFAIENYWIADLYSK